MVNSFAVRCHASTRVNILAPWANGARNCGEKAWCFFCNRYSELAFLCNGIYRNEILQAKTPIGVLY